MFLYLPITKLGKGAGGGGYWNHCVRVSVCPSVCMSGLKKQTFVHVSNCLILTVLFHASFMIVVRFEGHVDVRSFADHPRREAGDV